MAFKSSLRSILLLAIGAVFFTAAAVAIVAKLLLPDLPWWAVISLGAIVAPPDAVAAAAVLKQVALPKRIVTVLEGESLINDASSLVLYRFAALGPVAKRHLCCTIQARARRLDRSRSHDIQLCLSSSPPLNQGDRCSTAQKSEEIPPMCDFVSSAKLLKLSDRGRSTQDRND